MAVSQLAASSGANDFNVNVGATYTSIVFTKEYSSGSYSIVSLNNDTSYDVYIYNASGANVGYTKSGSLTASSGFSKMVILGGTTSDVLSFSYKTTYVSVDDSDEVTAGPVVTSVSPSAVPSIDDTFTVTGRNFATDCTVTFTGTEYTATAAKNIVRSSATSLIVTRPDNMPPTSAPFTITIENPGVTNPTGSNSHILPNSITSGTNPAWVTATPLPVYTKNVAYTQTLLASDTEASDVDYSIVSGAFPTGITLDGETGVISGTPTVYTDASFTVRALDAGGNFLDKAFSLPNINPNGPIWSTASGALTVGVHGTAYTTTVTGTVAAGTISYSLASGSLPTGTTLNSATGVISGTATGGNYSPVLRITDSNGTTADRSFTIEIGSAYQFALVGGGASSYANNYNSNTGRGGFGVFTATGCTGKTITYTVGATGGPSDSHGGSRAKGNGGGSGGGTWIKFGGTVFAAVGGGGPQAYVSDYGAHGGGFNSNGGTGTDNTGPSTPGAGGTTTGGGSGGGNGSNSGGFLIGGTRSSDSWGAPGAGGYYGGGSGGNDQSGQGGTPGGGGSGYLSVPGGFGTFGSILTNSGAGSSANGGSGLTVPGVSGYFANANQGGAANTGALRIWKDGTLILDTTTPQTDTSFTLS